MNVAVVRVSVRLEIDFISALTLTNSVSVFWRHMRVWQCRLVDGAWTKKERRKLERLHLAGAIRWQWLLDGARAENLSETYESGIGLEHFARKMEGASGDLGNANDPSCRKEEKDQRRTSMHPWYKLLGYTKHIKLWGTFSPMAARTFAWFSFFFFLLAFVL